MLKRQIIIPIGPSIAYVPLTRGYFTCIDVQDVATVGEHNWSCDNTGHELYAMRSVRTDKGYRKQSMQAFLLGISGRDITGDHITPGNGLDNRRANLRIANRHEQQRNRRIHKNNSTGYKGVSRRGEKYLAMIWNGSGNTRLGLFSTPELAHAAYVEASRIAYGDFAHS